MCCVCVLCVVCSRDPEQDASISAWQDTHKRSLAQEEELRDRVSSLEVRSSNPLRQ
jgi:hypothetical protein